MGSEPYRFTKLAIAFLSTAHQTINHNRCRVGSEPYRFTKPNPIARHCPPND
ncbi:MAG: hypothetical protein F6J90_13800 [Moorea sp. SIOASIH]|uniref:hypothetical protein n=1 Tax=Moorena sp. SIOASIH TaxID=2607817 RepID=UPI0013B83035|nr:hypothetical protein [Moorena sp. SIOASIH]NEO37339.1 hypothetical protein [Moorena sp. SIOASIH]